MVISVLGNADTALPSDQNRLRFPGTVAELTIVVWASIKDPRWLIRLQNGIAAVIEKELNKNQKLAYPVLNPDTERYEYTGDTAAQSVTYINSEVITDTDEEAAILSGATVQTWNVFSLPNLPIEIIPN